MVNEENNEVKSEEQIINPFAPSKVKIGPTIYTKGTEGYDREHGTNFAQTNRELDFDGEGLENFDMEEDNERTNLNISQTIADIVEIDLHDPTREDSHITADPAGNEKYFGCYVPEGYLLNQQGIWRVFRKMNRLTHELEDDAEMICRTRLMVTGKYINHDTGADVVEITFIADKKVETLLVPLVSTLGPKEWRDNVRKNNYGRLDVLDEELKGTLRFIKEVIRYNEEKYNDDPRYCLTDFKKGEVFERAGWSVKEKMRFVIGTSMYENDFGVTKVRQAHFIDTRNIDVDNRLKPKGTLHGWFNSIKSVIKYHKLKFAMYYAIGSMFLAPCKASNSAFGITGDTSIGKTFTLQAVASIFGNPSEKGDGLILNGNISLTALNAILTTLTDIPVFIDEIGMMPEDMLKALTYAIGNGQEYLRGKQDGSLRSSRMIRCNAIITGEVDIVGEFAHNGAAVRAFSCKERPIPKVQASTIEDARNGILENYGHVMKLVLAKYFMEPKKVEGLFNVAKGRLQQTTNDPIMQRKAAYFSVAEVGGIYFESILKDNGLPSEDPRVIIDEAWNEFVLDNPDIPLEDKDLMNAFEWCLSHTRNFLIGENQPLPDHPDDIYGYWVYDKLGKREFIDYIEAELIKYIRGRHDNPEKSIKYWEQHDYTFYHLQEEKKNGKTYTTKKYVRSAKHYISYGVRETIPVVRVKLSKIKEVYKKYGKDISDQEMFKDLDYTEVEKVLNELDKDKKPAVNLTNLTKQPPLKDGK